MRASPCGQCGQATGASGHIHGLEDLLAEFSVSHAKEIKVTTVDGATWDGALEHVHPTIIMLRTANQRKVWIPVDKIVTVMEGRSRQR